MSEIRKGRIVHFVAGENLEQAAIIVARWSDDCANLVVFRDGWNDDDGELPGDRAKLAAWRTSVVRSEIDQNKLSTWHFASECKSGA
jgi:hypothetical protein